MKIAAVSWLRVDPATRPGFVLLTHDWMIHLTDGRWILVPSGFWCDGASIPAALRPFFSPLVCLQLGIGHDYAVRVGALIHQRRLGDAEPFNLREATQLALALAARAGVGPVRRALIAAALRVAAPTYFHRRPMDWRP